MKSKAFIKAVVASIAAWGLLIGLASPAAHATTRYPNGIILRSETPVYANPDENKAPDAWLSPQDVYITGEQASPSSNGPNWYQIATWLGPKWVKLSDSDFRGQTEPVNTHIAVSEMQLYDEPQAGFLTGATITPQTVYSDIRSGDFFQITTWLGKKWIRMNDDMVLDVQPGTHLVLTGTTPLFDRPSADISSDGELSPQSVDAFEQVDGWYHIKTWLGEKWLNPLIFTPPGVTKNDEKIELWQPTKFYAYPSFLAEVKGVVAPQSVQAFEQVGNWLHVHSEWLGDSWVYRVPNPETYAPPANPLVNVNVGWNSNQLELGAQGGRDSPLSLEIDLDGIQTSLEQNKVIGILPYGTTMKINTRLMHTGDQQAITLTKAATFRLEIDRIVGQEKEPVWATDLPSLSGTLLSRGFVFGTDAIVWKQTDSEGRLLPPGTYEIRLTPDSIAYSINNKEYVQQWGSYSHFLTQSFEIVEQ